MDRHSDSRKQNGNKLKGMEIFEITPIILGGSPIESDNKIALTRQQHIDACRYWNDIIQKLRK